MNTDKILSIDGDNWREFTHAPRSVLVLTRSDCDACDTYTGQLETFVDTSDGDFDVPVGKMVIDRGGLAEFKQENDWIADVRDLPYTAIFEDGEVQKSFPGTGIERLERRLERLD